MKTRRMILLGLAALTVLAPVTRAWDYEIHRLVNELALASLPTNFPAFVRSPENAERIAFLSGEADRWRNTPDVTLNHVNRPDHYIDFEDMEIYGLDPQQLPPLRYDFVARLAEVRVLQPDVFKGMYTQRNEDHTKELIGLLPWTISEAYSRLKSGFSYFKAYEQGGGTLEEIANAQANIIYVMGVMGHFVGDATQPLHTTKHFNGWVGENPEGYTTSRGFHSWIDGGFWRKTGIPTVEELRPGLRTAGPVTLKKQAVPPERMFEGVVSFVFEQHQLVEPLYRLDKRGGLTAGSQAEARGKEFLRTQVLAGGQMLGDLWMSAWTQAPADSYLLGKLSKRKTLETKAE